jgi:hypothetical protein
MTKSYVITDNPQMQNCHALQPTDLSPVFVISTEGRNLTSSAQGDFSHPFEMKPFFQILAINLRNFARNQKNP